MHRLAVLVLLTAGLAPITLAQGREKPGAPPKADAPPADPLEVFEHPRLADIDPVGAYLDGPVPGEQVRRLVPQGPVDVEAVGPLQVLDRPRALQGRRRVANRDDPTRPSLRNAKARERGGDDEPIV